MVEKRIVVTDLWIFPIKSCKGTQLKESGYSETGLDASRRRFHYFYDRQWMIVEERSHRFLTARNIPRVSLWEMVLIHPKINSTTLQVDVPAWGDSPSSSHWIPLDLPSSITDEDLLTDVQIWGSSNTAYSVGTPELNAALSGFMGKPVLLVRKGDEPRLTAGGEIVETLSEVKMDYEGGSTIKWSDQFPVLLVSEASRRDVEKHVLKQGYGKENQRWSERGIQEQPLEILRWRGNVIVDGADAWEEDGWNEIRFEGREQSETMNVATRCARCMLPNVDPETGVRDKSVPDKPLRLFREGIWPIFAQKTFFGVNLVPRTARGTLRVGDQVVVVKAFSPKDDHEHQYERPEDQM
ncbi:BQ5605_C005g03558 [Microbotryum silenes-dioicae]|uniref:BQ5605_C005g03558 protein n=1 Tax=Microbotryum silenes-dioicae TaxID=796604 RepID=A0A2X0PCV5_9BASI|nr:BQ5605_C005g03558 [Microbotryum silenes-dioicae]